MRILSTEIEQLSRNKYNIQASARMNIQAMLRELDIEQRGEVLFISGSLSHAGHVNEFALEISSHGEIFAHDCSCSFHRPHDACGHIIALCRYLAEREYKLPYHFRREEEGNPQMRMHSAMDIERLMQRQAMRDTHDWLQEATRSRLDLHLSSDHAEPIRLYMIFEMDVTLFYRQLNLTFKIGRSGKKMYVVKDIAQLLSMVDEGVWHQYGKGLEFYHQMEAFDEESREILSMIRILCGNDDLASQAVKVLSENRLAGKVAVVAQDADLAACQRIVEGTQEMTVYKPIEQEANTAAEFAVALGKGEDITSGEGEYKAVETFNDGTYDIPYYKIDPIAVTAENMDKVIIDGGFHTREDVYLNIR